MRRNRWHFLWDLYSVGAIVLIVTFYGGLIVSSAVYLGWQDASHFFMHPRLWSRLFLTLWTACLATMISILIALPAGYALSRFSPPKANLINTLIDLPVMVPPAAVGVFLFGVVSKWPVSYLCSTIGLKFSHQTAGVILCQVAVTVAFAVRLSKAAFDAVPPRYEDVARTLGASWPYAIRKVTLPLAKGGIISSILVVFARAAAEWEALMLFVGATQGSTDTLPFAVYLDWNGGLMGWVTSMSLICVLMAVAVMGTVQLIGGRSYVW